MYLLTYLVLSQSCNPKKVGTLPHRGPATLLADVATYLVRPHRARPPTMSTSRRRHYLTTTYIG